MSQQSSQFSSSSSSSSYPILHRVAFIQSCWHKDIVDQCREAFQSESSRLGIRGSQIDFFEVPGAFEIPLHAKLLAKTGQYKGIVAAGLVVDGGVYRHDFVAQAVITALMQVQLEVEIPVFSAVLTPHHFHSHEDHQQFFHQHFVKKGQEAARACAETMTKIEALMLPHKKAELSVA